MAWVWHRFRNTFLASPEEERCPDDIDQRLLSIQLSRLRAYVSDDDEESDPEDHADPSLVQCGACLATVRRMRDRHPRRCPLCGHRLRLCDDPCPDRPVKPSLRLRPSRRPRARKQRSGSDPNIPRQGVVAGVGVVQLPAIDVDCTFLNNSIGRHNFLGRTEVFPGDLISRPGSETSLPPIGGDRDAAANRLSASGQSAELRGELRAAISAECLYMQSPMPPAYPARTKTREEFLLEVRRAVQSDEYADVQRFYMRTFDSYVELCALFKENPHQDGARLVDPDLKMDFLYAVYDALRELPNSIHKSVLKSMINAICQENLPVQKEAASECL